MNAPAASLELMSTRLFPKDRGADQYRLSGIAARCDWVVLSDRQQPQVALRKSAWPGSPRHVFVSLRSPFAAFDYFFQQVLPQITGPFVLVTGSEDATVPRQVDARWRRFTREERARFDTLLDDPRLLRWFAENLDEKGHRKLSALPLGGVFAQPDQSACVPVPKASPLVQRPLRILCAHRIRRGAQWETRRQVTELCRGPWSAFSTVVDEELPEAAYWELVRQHSFAICAVGGGLDPSPKAWLMMLHGTIPIALSSALDDAYADLPVVLLDEWSAPAINAQKLRQWLSLHAPCHDDGRARDALLERLGIQHWWAKIAAAAAG